MKTALTLLIPILLLIIFDSLVFAQQPKWELEGHGGVLFTLGNPGGEPAMPPAGAPFTTLGGNPSRRVSSWLFGDGALLLSQASFQYNVPVNTPIRPAPLDSLLRGPLVKPSEGGAFGVRLGRRLSSRLIAELTVDRLPEVRQPKSASNTYVAAANAFGALWRNMVPAPRDARATFSEAKETQRRTIVTGSANVEFAAVGQFRPYLAGGAGIERRSGKPPTASITGEYTYRDFFSFLDVNETDHVQLTGSAIENRLVGVVGGGVRIPVSQRLGFRADARVYLSANHDETFVSTTTPPARIPGASSTYFDVGANPAIQLQSFPPPSPDSEVSFSGPKISNFRTFKGTGMESSIAVTVGVFWRF